MLRTALLWASQNRTLAERLPRYRFARKAVQRFMPGERVEDAIRASYELQQRGVATVISRLGENVTEMSEAADVARHYHDVLDTLAESGLDTTISVKPTQLGLDISEAACGQHLDQLVEHAHRVNRVIWVDMEHSSCVDRTIELFEATRQSHANVGICVQAYLHRTPHDLDRLLRSTTAIRLVKGAYREPAAVAIQSKREVDSAYMQLASRLIEECATGREVGAPPAFATHDTRILDRIAANARERGIANDAFEIQMLYGIQREQQVERARQGYKVRCLISYGSAWFPWYMRRLAERPANVWFLIKNIV